MLQALRKIDLLVHRHWVLGVALLLLIVLRIPNFFEPYWYGDEAIYLTLGTAMRHGERLYAEIIDHKTPLIYYFAMVPNQLYFRVLNVAATLLTTTFFYFFARKMIRGKIPLALSTILFVILTTLPWFEGHIPNGELFVMFFILAAAFVLSKTTLFSDESDVHFSLPDYRKIFFAGVLMGLAILTKVPALFDCLGLLFFFWLALTHGKLRNMKDLCLGTVAAVLGITMPIVLSVVYFVARGSGAAYLNYGLLYNFHYIENWTPTFSLPWLSQFFTLPVKAAITAGVLLALTLQRKICTRHFAFAFGWFFLALFASLLSNRPYPHYYLQIIPPLALLFGITFAEWRKIPQLFLSSAGFALFVTVLLLLHVGLYSTQDYYGKFFQLITHQMSWPQYRDSFNGLTADNYKAAAIIRTSNDERMFIWGTDPMLYALTEKSPTGRFTVAFHIFDFKAEQESLEDVKTYAPTYIVVMKEERPFPELSSYLEENYMANTEFQHLVLWKRR